MRFELVSRHIPHPDGSAAGRVLLATGEGLLASGHEVRLWSWSPQPPPDDLPDWCEWVPLPSEAAWRTRLRALIHPRADVVRARPHLLADGVAVAEEPSSFAAVADSGRAVTVVHYATALDVPATPRRWQVSDLQDVRAERRAVRGSALSLVYSDRVAAYLRSIRPADRIAEIPIALRVPETPIEPLERPIALLVADWRWPPNRSALGMLLSAWPSVRDRVPGASLVLAGRGETGVGTLPGVEQRGEVPRSAELLAEAGVLAFPCPDTSGPKVKVLEACAAGLPVVTTPAGVEGLRLPADGVAVAPLERYADALVRALNTPAERMERAERARHAIRAIHAPAPAASARVAACDRLER